MGLTKAWVWISSGSLSLLPIFLHCQKLFVKAQLTGMWWNVFISSMRDMWMWQATKDGSYLRSINWKDSTKRQHTHSSYLSSHTHTHLFHSHVSFDRELLAHIKIVFLSVLCLRTRMVWGGSVNTYRGSSVRDCWGVWMYEEERHAGLSLAESWITKF